MTGITGGHRAGVAEVYNALYAGRLVQTSGVHQLATDTMQIFGVVIQNDPDSSADVLVGNGLVQYFKIEPGSGLTIPIDRLTKIFVSFLGSATVNYLAMG